RLGVDGLAIDERKAGALDMGDEVAVRPAGDHRDLAARLAERGQRLGELQLPPGIGTAEHLDDPQTTCRTLCTRCRRCLGLADSPGLASSTRNLILYLPSSITSLLRRMFFLTGWPFR